MTTARQVAPYAPAKAVLEVVDRYRDRGLPDPLTQDGLVQVGIAQTMASRTLAALRFLALVDEGGNRLEAFERLRRASTEEYPGILAEVVQAAYLPIFTIVNPAEDGDIAVSDAFRRYEPANQREKMVALFHALCQASGIEPVKPRRRRVRAERADAPRQGRLPRTPTPPPSREDSAVSPEGDGATHEEPGSIDYRLITAIIQQLPRDGRWTKERRERWLSAMTSAVDLVLEVNDEGV